MKAQGRPLIVDDDNWRTSLRLFLAEHVGEQLRAGELFDRFGNMPLYDATRAWVGQGGKIGAVSREFMCWCAFSGALRGLNLRFEPAISKSAPLQKATTVIAQATVMDPPCGRQAELINHEFDRLERAAARISKAKETIDSAQMTENYACDNAGRWLIEAKKRLYEFDSGADFEAWCLAHVRRSMPDCYRCMARAGWDEPEHALWKERAGPESASTDDWAGSGEAVERRLTAREMAAADSDVLPLHTHAQAGAKGGRGKKASNKVTSFSGNSAAYLVAKLKRDAPEFAERLAAGEFRSARAAALAAGVIKPDRRR
jgi:hypothetical protein